MSERVLLPRFTNSAGTTQEIAVYYDCFGRPLDTAPVVLVNHSLTGNSCVTGENGWWQDLVGPGKCIDTGIYSVISLNVPGNSAGGKEDLLENYSEFTLGDIAEIFLEVLEELKVSQVFAIIGGSIGGALAWEMAALSPDLAEWIIPIAADLKPTPWVLAQCRVQEQILSNSSDPVHDARLHAMTFYRTPQSLSVKFGTEQKGLFEVKSWLLHHGTTLRERFPLSAYKLMNHLLSTIDISRGNGNFIDVAGKIRSEIHIISIDSDLLFTAEENRENFEKLSEVKENVSFSEIHSVHGHDAFLIEFGQLDHILTTIFKPQKIQKHEDDTCSYFWNR